MAQRKLIVLPHLAVLGCLFAACPGSTGQAAEASGWEGDARASVRLIAGQPIQSGASRTYRAGIEVRLAAAWKTYWRYPGDSGVPPRFGFTRSENVAAVTVLWPAPSAFEEAGNRSIGYKGQVIFPLRIVSQDATKSVRLRVDFDYAVCEKICIPAEAKLELELDGAPSAYESDLRHGEMRIARKAALGDAGALAIRAIRQEAGSPERVLVELAAPPGSNVELFAEGPTPEWALPIPVPLSGPPDGTRRFAFTLDGLPPGATARGAILKLTAVANGEAIEVETRLD